MKQHMLFLSLTCLTLTALAQQAIQPHPDVVYTPQMKTNSITDYWGNIVDQLSLSDLVFVSNASLFPDSTVKQLYPGPVVGGKPTYTLGHTYLHAAGQIFDPKYGNSPVSVNRFNRYTLDSAAIYFRYTRRVNVSDTLLIQIYGNDKIERYNLTDVEGIVRDKCGRIACDPITYKPAQADRTIRYILTNQDTSVDINYRRITVPAQIEIAPDGIAAVAVSFIPGYTYQADDTLQQDWFPAPVHKMNQFQILTYNDLSKQKLLMYNNGIFLNKEFMSNPVAWGDRLIPGNIYSDAFRYTYIDFHITVLNSGKEPLIVKEQNLYPNPAALTDIIYLNADKYFKGQMDILNTKGELLHTKNIELSPGENELKLPEFTEQGMYLLRFYNASTEFSKRILFY